MSKFTNFWLESTGCIWISVIDGSRVRFPVAAALIFFSVFPHFLSFLTRFPKLANRIFFSIFFYLEFFYRHFWGNIRPRTWSWISILPKKDKCMFIKGSVKRLEIVALLVRWITTAAQSSSSPNLEFWIEFSEYFRMMSELYTNAIRVCIFSFDR